MKRLLFGLLLPFGLLGAALPEDGPSVGTSTAAVFWPCNSKRQDAFDSKGQINRYTNPLPGGGWSEAAALAAAAENHHGDIRCQTCPDSGPGCVKVIQWSNDCVFYVSGGSPATPEFTYTVDNFKVWGFCTTCL